MLNESELKGLEHELSDFRSATSQHHDALQSMTSNYAQLLEEYQRLRSDYEEEKESREKYKKLARGQERNPFVLVLVDGDGYIFEDALVKAGAEGGVRAANLLNAAIKDNMLRSGYDLADARIMVRVYTNLAGLSKALSRAGLSGNEARSLAPFCASFTRAQDLFDFVDAGDKKENADFKIREMFRLFAENSQCKHIFFAGCHDVGYLSMLTPYTGKSDRISLIRGASVHPEFQKLHLRFADFPGVFRSYPLEGYNNANRPALLSKASNQSIPNHSSHQAYPSPHYDSHSPPPSAPRKICTHFLKGTCKYGASCKNSHATGDSWRSSTYAQHPGITSTTNAPPERFGNGHSSLAMKAQDARTNPSPPSLQAPFSATLPRLTRGTENMIPLNKDGNRLDFYLSPPTSEQWSAYTQRAKIHKICNDYHLTGQCNNGIQCHYDHSPLDPELRHVLKFVVHDYPCSRRGACREQSCNLGHICFREACHGSSGKGGCRLNRAMHGVDPIVTDWVPAVSSSGNARSGSMADTDDVASEIGGAEVEFDSPRIPWSVNSMPDSIHAEHVD